MITSHELLPKFKRILKDKEDKVKTIVYLENPIKRTDVSGYRLAETHFSNLHDIYIYVFSRTVQSTTTCSIMSTQHVLCNKCALARSQFKISLDKIIMCIIHI